MIHADQLPKVLGGSTVTALGDLIIDERLSPSGGEMFIVLMEEGYRHLAKLGKPTDAYPPERDAVPAE